MSNTKDVAGPIVDDQAWQHWRDQWPIRADTIYLNHGSFGPTPKVVRECQLDWQQQLASQPMDFFVRKYEPAWLAARERLAEFVGTAPDNLVFVENATAAMNVVANTVPLQRDDQVLLTDHEYGAVFRIWQRVCEKTPGAEVTTARLPLTIDHLAQYARQQIVDLTGLEPSTPDNDQWYGSMVSLPLPPGDAAALQRILWQEHRIEVPIVEHNGQRSIRVSCHLYNRRADTDFLLQCLKPLLRQKF